MFPFFNFNQNNPNFNQNNLQNSQNNQNDQFSQQLFNCFYPQPNFSTFCQFIPQESFSSNYYNFQPNNAPLYQTTNIGPPSVNSEQNLVRSQNSTQNQNQNQRSIIDRFLQQGCSCSKTGCIKQYCRCFKAGGTCTQACKCIDCRNSNVEQIIRLKGTAETQKQVRCNCKKTKCMNKYCDCLAAGKKCGQQCKCSNCHN